MVLLLAGGGLGAGLWLRSALQPVGATEQQLFHVPNGSSGGSVAGALRRAGLIRDARAFKIGLRIWGLGAELKPGYYDVSADMSPKAIAEKIASGDTAKWRLTIPEGFTAEQIAERASEHPTIDAQRFLTLVRGTELAAEAGLDLPGASGLEGFLFPETYPLEYGISDRGLILALLHQFKSQVKPLEEEIAASALSLTEVVTLASLIERETMLAEERTVVSAVYHNRMARGMLLECDATVVYAWLQQGVFKERLLYRDLEIDSPYNTYKYPGLPRGPIANPGLDCIKAALRPADVDYLYYVARGDGGHVFTETLRNHLNAIARIRGR
jgi:UPF0755 protein